MRLLLAMPTVLRTGYEDYFSASPLGIETLGAHARTCADVELMDMRGRGNDTEAHAELLLARDPDILGLCINSAPHFNYSIAVAAAVKQRRPEITVIVGGQQATFLAEEILATGAVDAVVRGEGEHALCEILTQGSVKGVAGVSWRSDGVIHNEPSRPQIANLDDIRPPARDLLSDRRRYRMGAYRIEGVESSRGCPHHCWFCSVRNFHRGTWRPKSVPRVMAEIDHILETQPEAKVIYFADDSFATDIKRVEQICREIVQRRSDVYFWCQARGDTLGRHPEVVEWMGRAHFAAVLMGVETPIPHLLAEARKGSSTDEILAAIKLLHQHDIGVWGTFVLGLPGETAAESETSAAFISTTGVDVVQITVATPIPGSQLYDDAVAKGQLTTNDWDDYDFSSPTMTTQMSKEHLDALLQKAYLKSYLSWHFFGSLFSGRTNLHRLRRTSLRVFGGWIGYVLKERLADLFRRGNPGQGKESAATVGQAATTVPLVNAEPSAPATVPVEEADRDATGAPI